MTHIEIPLAWADSIDPCGGYNYPTVPPIYEQTQNALKDAGNLNPVVKLITNSWSEKLKEATTTTDAPFEFGGFGDESENPCKKK